MYKFKRDAVQPLYDLEKTLWEPANAPTQYKSNSLRRVAPLLETTIGAVSEAEIHYCSGVSVLIPINNRTCVGVPLVLKQNMINHYEISGEVTLQLDTLEKNVQAGFFVSQHDTIVADDSGENNVTQFFRLLDGECCNGIVSCEINKALMLDFPTKETGFIVFGAYFLMQSDVPTEGTANIDLSVKKYVEDIKTHDPAR